MASVVSPAAVAEAIPLQDLTRLHASIGTELRDAIEEVILGSSFVGAAYCADFEQAFATAHGVARAVGCGSGTDALALVLRALGIGPGDEVIVPALTFVASAEAVVHAGATPVLVDVDPRTLLIDPGAVAAACTPITRAIMPVHLLGHVVPLDWIDEWRSKDLLVVEDAAQAHLATWQGAGVGTRGDAACFSFYPGKNLGALGDAGAVVTNSDRVADAVAKLRDHGQTSKYHHEQIGWCSRLDGIQAAALMVKLLHLPTWTENRRILAARYLERLGDRLIPWEPGAVHHLICVVVGSRRRERVRSELSQHGIGVGVHFPMALTHQPALSRWPARAPRAEEMAGELLSLPIDPLMSLGEVDRVCGVLEQLLG